MTSPAHIRPLDPSDDDEVTLVATRMRETLVEVVGQERGTSMYTMDWLVDRVRWHLDQPTAEVLLATEADGRVVGHTILREECDDDTAPFGLISTTFVAPPARRRGIASALLAAGETWFAARGLRRVATHTAVDNHKLIGLYRRHGYREVLRAGEMIRLARTLHDDGK